MLRRDRLPRVSVIIPTHNRSNLLRLTVESVLAQTYPNIEIIVVDDTSTDDTAAVMEPYAERGQVTYIRQPNQGVSAARNRGFRAASGEYINFLDDDDLFMPAKIERQMQVLDARPEIGLVYCGYYSIDKDGHPLEKVWPLPTRETLKELVLGCFILVPMALVHRKCLEQAGLFDKELGWSEDWDLWLRIAQAGYLFACIQEPLCQCRILPDSKMTNVAKMEHGAIAALDKVFASPGLPADVVALKAEAYASRRFWISCMHYAVDRWDDAQRNLTQALALKPEWLDQPEGLLRDLDHNALNLRVDDPVRFVTGMFDHLPPEAEKLERYRSRLLGHVHAGLALREYGNGKIVEAKGHLADAITAHPALIEHADEFAGLLSQSAVKLRVRDPLAYVETVIQNLPDGAQRLARSRSRVLSDVNLAYAFQDYSAGRRWQVVRRVVAASRDRPACLRNRGVCSILLKSLWPAPLRPG